jgi:hypothetical protein
MKIKKYLTRFMLVCCMGIATSSCAEWLKVDMEDGIMEDALYQENEGFLTVLNGAYSSLNEVYGTSGRWGRLM